MEKILLLKFYDTMTNKYSIWISALLAACVCIAMSGIVFAASPQLPCEFYGSALVQGSPVPVGSVISAYVNGTLQGSITVVEAGKFGGLGTFDERLIVMAGDNDFANGVPTISFKINDQPADQTAPYQPGASTQVNLTVGGQSAVPAPAPVQPVTQGNNSTQVPVIVAQVSNPSPTPVVTPVQSSCSQTVQNVNVTALTQ
ncbi:hypothetical protein [Methanospirillum purgamenti]|uniref:Uncharacterized protein n=2 Tax=Methanospirillum TaxID=2202 RepID=A0A8F5VM54_METHU|nr:hypothetical protein [Methanospirillum hungatei]MDX8550435.1 hypothetical protein [Methanospirillum hungatei]NLW75171.1 hypothetical protein [Methanomicrobiales archaeon]QXO95612.1 hypothetical protein KSK55_04205 [Methanospirillum hungatei]